MKILMMLLVLGSSSAAFAERSRREASPLEGVLVCSEGRWPFDDEANSWLGQKVSERLEGTEKVIQIQIVDPRISWPVIKEFRHSNCTTHVHYMNGDHELVRDFREIPIGSKVGYFQDIGCMGLCLGYGTIYNHKIFSGRVVNYITNYDILVERDAVFHGVRFFRHETVRVQLNELIKSHIQLPWENL